MLPSVFRAAAIAALLLAPVCSTPAHAACGDAVVDGGEGCDDGNLDDGDGCSSACVIEPPLGRHCDLTFSVPFASDMLGALQIEVDYGGAGQFPGSGSMVQCVALTPNTLFAPNNVVAEQRLTLGSVFFVSQSAPLDVWRCGFDIQTAGGPDPSPAEFPITIQDATDDEGTPISVTVAVTEIVCDDDPLCGDGSVQPHEECDDANDADGDGCDSACDVEECWTCETPPLTTTTLGEGLPGPSECTPVANGEPCSDENACTESDQCTDGACTSGAPVVCPNDGNVCNGTATCEPASGCVEVDALDCDDGSACTDDSCDAVTGCASVDNGGVCCDVTFAVTSAGTYGSVQFTADYSSAPGVFVGAGSSVDCTSLVSGALLGANDQEVDELLNVGMIRLDGLQAPLDVAECGFFSAAGSIPSTSDFLVSVTESSDTNLEPLPATVAISDIVCNLHTCGDGAVQPYEECDDANEVAGDGCSDECEVEDCWTCDNTAPTSTTTEGQLPGPSICTPQADGEPCSDGDACTDVDLCMAGTCTGGAPVACLNDADVCNGVYSCVSPGGCQLTSPVLDCDDGDGCTDDSCDAETGCQHVPNDNLCCDITFQLDSASSTVGALQFETDYSAAAGAFDGEGGSVSCTNLLPGSLFSANDLDATQELIVGHVKIDGFTAPADLSRCGFHSTSGLPPEASDFVISILDATDTNGEPITAVPVIHEISCPDFGACPAEPSGDCLEAGASSLVVKDSASDKSDALKWKWKKGESFGITHISDPTDDGLYTLCLYPDATGPAEQILVPPSPSLWRALSDVAFKYKDAAAGVSGIRGIKIRPGLPGESSIGLTAKGLNLPPNLLPSGASYTIQLRDARENLCWSSSFTSGVLKETQYSAKTP